MKKKESQKDILEDHKKIGKKLVPPLAQFQNLDTSRNSNYYEGVVPEAIWIAFLNKSYGYNMGIKFFTKFLEIVIKIKESKNIPYYISWYYDIDDEIAKKIRGELIREGIYKPINESLTPLLNAYPECPLNKVFENHTSHSENDVTKVKDMLLSLVDKTSAESTFLLANTLYFLMIKGKMKVTKDSLLAKLPLIQDYPNSEISKMIASAVRASSNLMFNKPIIERKNDTWINYFWNRGLELEACEI